MIVPRRPDANSPARGDRTRSHRGAAAVATRPMPVAVIPDWRALGTASGNMIRGEHEIASVTERGTRRPVSRCPRVGEAASPTSAGPRRELAQSERRRGEP